MSELEALGEEVVRLYERVHAGTKAVCEEQDEEKKKKYQKKLEALKIEFREKRALFTKLNAKVFQQKNK